ncbi:MFS general substrate transporter, partial [Clavulina sp. PMI_390]
MQEGFVRKQWAIRALALLCACSLSVGAHFGREFLGPIKSRLAREIGSSNSDFSTILASYSVNNTWTPLVAGLLAARLGTSRTSLLATSLVFGGQCILMIGRATKSIGAMAAGLFFFGLGTSPVSVVQETIIVRFFATTPYLGTFLSIGLLMGKASGFLSAYTSYPLSELNPMAPFVVSVLLSGFSWLVNWVFVAYGAWMRRAAGVEEEDGDSSRMSASEQGLMRRREALSSSKVLSEQATLEVIARKKRVFLLFEDLVRLGDVFWLYLAFNFLCGSIWSPFTHIAANLFQVRYGYSEADASWTASFLHAGSLILYPIAGYLSDRSRHQFIVYKLALISSFMTLACYGWLLLPVSMTGGAGKAMPGVVLFGIAEGFSTLLLVLMVPRLVPAKYIPTALGAHKSIESAGSTISLTLAGAILD